MKGRGVAAKICSVNVVPIITGYGLITPLGHTVGDTWRSVLAGRSITSHARVEVASMVNQPRVAALAVTAASEAIAHAGWGDRLVPANETAIVVGTSKGAIESWITTPPPLTSDKPLLSADYQRPSPSGDRAGSPCGDRFSVQNNRCEFGLANIARAVADATGLTTSARLTLSAACASGLHALIRGAMMIRAGEARRVLIVACEASVHPLFLGSFRRLGVLPPEGTPCRPFDSNRQGFLMSEAAAAVCLEAFDPEMSPAVQPIVAVERYGMAGDAVHLTAANPDGSVFRGLLRRVLAGREVDLIHAHGTGTLINDPIELSAIDAAMEYASAAPVIYSHKGALGHSLGAAGLISVVLNCLAHGNGKVPGNINTALPLPTTRLRLSSDVIDRPVHRSLVCASGFGGPMAVVSLISP